MLPFLYTTVYSIDQNPTIWCHLEEDRFPFETVSAQGFFLMSSLRDFPCLLMRDLDLNLDFWKTEV